MHTFTLLTSMIFVMALHQKQQDKGAVRISVIYDNYYSGGNTEADWGFSCLIEGRQKTILFDTGTKPQVFERNAEEMSANLKNIDALVISHNHGDHTGGIEEVLEHNPSLPVYLPISSTDEYLYAHPAHRKNVKGVKESEALCEGVTLTGELGGGVWEQSIILETSKGLVIITGCAHPGIIHIIEQVRQLKDDPIYMVLGGFHLFRHSEDAIVKIIREFKAMGVQKCGASHCTGDEAIDRFRSAYGDDFVDLGTGNQIEIPI